MGLLNKQAHGREPDLSDDPVNKEEDYEKMFVKIARDFIGREDFAGIIQELITALEKVVPGLSLLLKMEGVDLTQQSKAIEKANLYKKSLKGSGGIDPKQYIKQDIINSKEFCNEIKK